MKDISLSPPIKCQRFSLAITGGVVVDPLSKNYLDGLEDVLIGTYSVNNIPYFTIVSYVQVQNRAQGKSTGFVTPAPCQIRTKKQLVILDFFR